MAINNNSLEQLLEAIDIIASQRASENNAYDQTIICTIVDNSKAEQYGYYTVTNDTLTFQAYSDNLTYKVGNYVRVSIPNGDYSQQKYITGLYQYNTGEAVSYVSPLDTFMGISTLIDGRATPTSDKLVNQATGLIANGNDSDFNTIPPVIIGSADASMQASGMYDTIGLQADFKCALGSQYNIRSGSYGLQLDLTIKLDGTNQTVIHSIYMDSANFFGDPYNFKVYSTQAQTYDISNLGGTIVSFVAKPYQRDDFTYETNGTIVRLPASEKEANIFVANIYVALGNDLYKVENHTVKLYTNNSLSYKHSSENGDLEALNTKTLSVLYYNKDENNEYIGFNDGRWTDKNNPYDELQYLGAVEDDRRLRGQRGTDIPDTFGTLDMLDRYYKILPVIDETIGYVETTVVRTLQSLKRELTGCGAVNAIVDGWVGALNSNVGAAKDKRTTLVKGIFDEKNKVKKNWSVQQIDIDFFDFSGTLDASYWPIFDGDIFAPEIKRVVTEDYPQYRSIYEDYAKQMLEIKARVEKSCAKITIETSQMHNCEVTTKNIDFIEKDFSVYDNYYDIFWYRENPTWAEPDRFMPTGWEPISQNDIGLPTEQDPDKPGYLIKYCPNDRNNITVVLNGDTKKERFRVVIVHNHNCYYSNILEFTNVDEFAEEEIMTSEAIELKYGEHSRESYQMLYSSGYQLINRADARLDRAIELACKEEFGGNESLCGATVYWYIPANLTMLTYDEELLTTSRELQYDDEQKLKVTIEPLTKLDESETEGPYQYFRPGYHCFYKQVSEKPVENADHEALDKWAAALTEDLKFYYSIKENLVPCNVHNDIECVVVLDDENKTTLEASIRVVFGALGTNGTNYSLVVMPATKQYCVTNNDPMPIDIALYDYDGNWVEDATFETSWNGPTNYTHNNNQVSMTNPDEENPNNDTGVGILTVKTTIGIESPKEGGRDRIVDLFVQYPISWGKNKGDYIAGATTITYNSNGSNPEYYKGPYVLYDKNHQEQTGIEWYMEWYDGSQKSITAENNKFYGNYMPVLTNNNTIVPSPMYVAGCECYPVVVAKQNGNEVWRQPIVITQNRYPSQYLNQWDGSLEIDENNGTIMSNLVGAGKKEIDNSFSGVLMGEVAKVKIDTNKDPVQNLNHSGLGLYGFHYGAQSFGFNVDGTAFIGKSGGGRISFDGNQGFIYSDNWLQSFEEGSRNKAFIHNSDGYYELGEGKDGMAIDLHSGHIDANNFRLRSENIKMNSGNRLDQNKYIINFETSKQMRPIAELINIGNISVPYYELIDGVYASRSKEEAAEILNNNGTLYTTFHCNVYDYNKNKYDFPGFSENKQYYIKNADGAYIKYTADPLEFKEGSVLYDFIDKGHGCYYIRFDKDGNLDLSISDGTFLADSGLTLKEYFDKIRNDTTVHIEDEVIGIPPELEADTVFDFITGEVDRIENDVIGLPDNLEKDTIYSYVNAQEYLTTEGVFNGLTDNGNKLGVFSVDKNEDGNIEELYINASYITTGILRSANWKGTLTYYPDNGDPVEYRTDDTSDAITKVEEAIANGQASWEGKWSIVADEGTYWDLNNGQLFAKCFELNALDGDGNGLYLSNNPDSNGHWLFVGNGDNFINMTAKDGLLIKTNHLSVDAWGNQEYSNKTYTGGIVLDSSIGSSQPWLLVGSQQTNGDGDIVDGNFIQFTKDNDLIIQIGSGSFILNAWNGVENYKEGIYINSRGYDASNNNKVYFRAGTVHKDENIDDSNLIEVSNKHLLLRTTNFILDAYNSNEGGIYLNSAPGTHSSGNITAKDSYLYIGGKDHFIQYTGGHKLKINVNDFTVDAYYNNGNKGIYFNSNPEQSKEDYYFIIGNKGNFIQLDGNGNLTFQTNENFIINAWDDSTGGIYLNNSPDNEDYFRIGNNSNFISYGADGLQIQVDDLIIGDEKLSEALKATAVTEESVSNVLKELDGIVEIDGKFYFSSHYIHIKDSSGGTLFLADGTNNKVEIAGWDVTTSGFESPHHNTTIGTNGIICTTTSGLEPLEVRQYSINASSTQNAYTSGSATISNWNSSTAWYNFAYGIVSNNEFTIHAYSGRTLEYFIVDKLPTGNGTINFSAHAWRHNTSDLSTFTIPAGNQKKILIINQNIDSAPLKHDKFFRLTPTEGLYVEDAEISGKITATDGEIGGWTISPTALHTANNNFYLGTSGITSSIGNTSIDDLIFKAGANFGVNADGYLYATNANIIDGKITSHEGEIAFFTINRFGILGKSYRGGSSVNGKTYNTILSPGWGGNGSYISCDNFATLVNSDYATAVSLCIAPQAAISLPTSGNATLSQIPNFIVGQDGSTYIKNFVVNNCKIMNTSLVLGYNTSHSTDDIVTTISSTGWTSQYYKDSTSSSRNYITLTPSSGAMSFGSDDITINSKIQIYTTDTNSSILIYPAATGTSEPTGSYNTRLVAYNDKLGFTHYRGNGWLGLTENSANSGDCVYIGPTREHWGEGGFFGTWVMNGSFTMKNKVYLENELYILDNEGGQVKGITLTSETWTGNQYADYIQVGSYQLYIKNGLIYKIFNSAIGVWVG